MLYPERNEDADSDARAISTDDSAVAVLVVPTNEELEIARQTRLAMDGNVPAGHHP